jgi:hypothetical protein
VLELRGEKSNFLLLGAVCKKPLQTVVLSSQLNDDDVFCLFLQKQKIGAKFHIPLGRYVP